MLCDRSFCNHGFSNENDHPGAIEYVVKARAIHWVQYFPAEGALTYLLDASMDGGQNPSLFNLGLALFILLQI